MLSEWGSSAETITSAGALTPPTGFASTWTDFVPSTSPHSNITEPNPSQTPLSSDMTFMDTALLETIAFGLEQFPPHLGFSMAGFTSNDIHTNTLHVPLAATMSNSDSQRRSGINHEPISLLETGAYYSSSSPNTDQLLDGRRPQQCPPSPDYATALGLSDPRSTRTVFQKKTSSEASARSVSPSSQDSDEDRLQEKRQRNKLAARRLRQKKMNQMSDLEARLEEMTKERDDLRLKAAKWEGEVMVLRQMLGRDTTK
ncbi:hypothetical protein F1880_005345 [Penicillium rolfsii]|nr:hypothetical protein F1880_005345 [Penicillium rolfsii]